MVSPKLLFVERAAGTPGRIQAKAVSCTNELTRSWDPKGRWRGHIVPDGVEVDVSVVIACTSPTTDSEYVSVFAPEPFLPRVPGELRWRLLSIQNSEYVHLQSASSIPPAPFFISFLGDSHPVHFVAQVQLVLDDIRHLPDVEMAVRLFNQRAMAENRRLGRDFFHQRAALDAVPLPSNCTLPGTLASANEEIPMVYVIRNRLGQGRVECDIHLSEMPTLSLTDYTLVRTVTHPSVGTLTQLVGRVAKSSVTT